MLLLHPAPAALIPESRLDVSLDLVLSHYRIRHPRVCFLQIGAYDGVTGDAIYPLIGRHALTGILLEPQREIFTRLQANYARFPAGDFVLVNAAVSDHDGNVSLYRIPPGAPGPEWLTQTASLTPGFHQCLEPYVPGVQALVEEEPVTCMTFDTLFRTYALGHVDLLQVDTEGLDADVLQWYDVPARRPAIVRFEHKHLAPDVYERAAAALIESGYKLSVSRDDTLAYHTSFLV